MNKTKFTLLIGLGLLTGWVTPSAIQAAGQAHSGLIGQVFIGPTCPNIPPGFDCPDRPFQTSISVYSDTGRFITRFTTDAEGQFADRGDQYRTAIFYHDDAQKAEAIERPSYPSL